jgi:flavin-dependent dehydrogenase
MTVVIVGGGLAGTAAALHLAIAGREATLIEKETMPHDKVCGEFLSHEAVMYLTALGIDLPALGAVAIDRVRFEGRTRKLPFAAQSLSRRVLDEALLTRAQDAGVTVMRGRKVQSIERMDDSWRLKLSLSPMGEGARRAGEGGWMGSPLTLPISEEMGPFPLPSGRGSIDAPSVFLASGKHDVRGRKRGPGRQNDLVGFKIHWRLMSPQQRALNGAVELFLFPGGYGGLEPVENGKANLCFLIRRNILETLGSDWDKILQHICAASPLIADRLAGAQALWDRPLAITSIPYGYVRRDSDGLWRLGDQAAVIPSFSGDGMSIALHSAKVAAEVYLAGGDAAQYQARLARDVQRQVFLATAISRALVDPVGQKLCYLLASRLIGMTAKATRIPERLLLPLPHGRGLG